MSPLFGALAGGIAAYVVFMVAVPKATPRDRNANLKSALDRLHAETHSAETSHVEVLREQLSEQSAFVRAFFGLGFMRPLHEAAVESGYASKLDQLLLFMVMLVLGAFVGFMALTKNPLLALVGAPALTYLLTINHCRGRLRKRNHQFIDQFPDALDMIVRSVRSGFPLSTALQILTENTEEPMRGEFREVVDDIALGRTLSQALSRLALRVNEPDVQFFVVVLSVQQETGGNLSEIIGNLSTVIRKRKHLRLRIKALTSEGKATGWVLGALPVFVFGALKLMQPRYLDPFFTDPIGQHMLMLVGFLMLTCFFVVRRMIDIEI